MRFEPVTACLLAVLVTTVFNVAFTCFNLHLLSKITPPRPKEYSYIGSDYPAQLPLSLPVVGMKHELGDPYFSLLNDTEWGTLFPTSGFTPLGPHKRSFQLSMIHQFHCLDVIRVGFVTNRTGAWEHVQHCLRYLRQSVLCHSDLTLEQDTPILVDGEVIHTASGTGEIHRCRDWTKVRHYLLDHPTPIGAVGTQFEGMEGL